MLRSEIYSSQSLCMSISWSLDDQTLYLADGNLLVYKSIRPSEKENLVKICDFGNILKIKVSKIKD